MLCNLISFFLGSANIDRFPSALSPNSKDPWNHPIILFSLISSDIAELIFFLFFEFSFAVSIPKQGLENKKSLLVTMSSICDQECKDKVSWIKKIKSYTRTQ